MFLGSVYSIFVSLFLLSINEALQNKERLARFFLHEIGTGKIELILRPVVVSLVSKDVICIKNSEAH